MPKVILVIMLADTDRDSDHNGGRVMPKVMLVIMLADTDRDRDHTVEK